MHTLTTAMVGSEKEMEQLRVGVIIPSSQRTHEELEDRRVLLQRWAFPGTQVNVCKISSGPSSLESHYDDALAAAGILEAVDRLQAENDALILYCFGDPALEAAREISRVPVVGPGEASMHIASMLSTRFSIVTVLPETVVATRERVNRVRVERFALASIRALGIPVLDLKKDSERTVKAATEVARLCVTEDGAESIILGCLGFAGLGSRIEQGANVPVIDPGLAALKMAESLAAAHWRHSSLSYPRPTSRK